MSGASNAVRLRQYLLALSPQARMELRQQLARAASSEAAVILDELCRLEPFDLDAPARLFFQPLEPFIVDDVMERPFRLPRSSLPQLWRWVARDLLRDEASEFSDATDDALAAGAHVYDLRGITETLDADDSHVGLIQFKVGTGGKAVEYAGEWDLPLNRLLYKGFCLYMNRRG